MKEYITFACGHESAVRLYGKAADRERKAKWLAEYGTCPICEAKEREEKREKDALEAKALDFPALQGSPKQVVWAESIRMDRYKLWVADIDAHKEVYTPEMYQEAKNTLEYIIRNATEASEWIDQRGSKDGAEMIRSYAKQRAMGK